jgi:hypothetical protein
MAKQIRLALKYDSFTVEGETAKTLELAFDSPPLAKAAFGEKLAKSRKRKRLEVVDETRAIGGLQCAWRGEVVTRAWMTALETHDKVPNKLAAEQLAAALPGLPAVEELGFGLPQWANSHKGSFDGVLAVLEKARPAVRALAFGDYDNEGGHIVPFVDVARVAAIYPGLERLRVTAHNLEAHTFDRPWPALRSLAVRWRNLAGDWAWLLAGKRTPMLEELRVPGALVAELASSPLARQLRRVWLYEADEAMAARLPGLEVTIVPSIDRYRTSRE